MHHDGSGPQPYIGKLYVFARVARSFNSRLRVPFWGHDMCDHTCLEIEDPGFSFWSHVSFGVCNMLGCSIRAASVTPRLGPYQRESKRSIVHIGHGLEPFTN